MSGVVRVRFWRYLRRAFWNALLNTARPFLSSGAFLKFLSLPAFLLLLLFLSGWNQMQDEAAVLLAGAGAVLVAVPLFFVVNLLLAPFRILADEKRIGTWTGGLYTYNEPQLLATIRITPDDDNRVFPIFAKDAEPNSLISYKIESEQSEHRVKVQVCFSKKTGPIMNWGTIRQDRRGGIRVGKDRKMYLAAKTRPEYDAVTFRIYMLSWEV